MKNLRSLAASLSVAALLSVAPAPTLAQTRPAPAAARATQAQSGIPAHPRELKYAPLEYTPPKRDKYRHVLSNGAVAYLVEDHDLPLVNVSALVRTGTYLEPSSTLR